jgi:hypothetical protein
LSAELPIFNRDREAREHKEARARRVGELRPELIALLIDTAAPHLRGQIAIHWSTGARVSSLIYGCRLCDYLAVPGREQITFHDTKNGQRVEAAVHHPGRPRSWPNISRGAAISRIARGTAFSD